MLQASLVILFSVGQQDDTVTASRRVKESNGTMAGAVGKISTLTYECQGKHSSMLCSP